MVSFIKIGYDLYNKLKEEVEFEVWERYKDYVVIRLVASIKTSDKEIDDVITLIKK